MLRHVVLVVAMTWAMLATVGLVFAGEQIRHERKTHQETAQWLQERIAERNKVLVDCIESGLIPQ